MKLSILTTEGTKGSASMKRLAQGLSAKVGYKVFRTRKLFPRRRQLKYGHGVDKIQQYQWFKDNNIPALEFHINHEVVKSLLEAGEVIIGRKLINASCGKGIVVMQTLGDFTQCPVYTKYRKKKREFRVHVFQDKVVAIVEKRKRADWQGERDTHIRNLANGYVFCQEVTNVPEGLEALAISAARVVASDFKGVDIGYNEKKNELFVIEVNSAPGIEGTNVSKYVEAICG